ncbi:GNAT family N-acetyltransferase [Bdellovibrionota bacterium FG-2]
MGYAIEIRLTVKCAAEISSELGSFYQACGRTPSISPEDKVIVASLYPGDPGDSAIVGVVRLCFEHEIYVLRTMQVQEDLQGKGVGRLILNHFKQLLLELRITQVYCMPYAHLERFYGLIEFKTLELGDAPRFLKERANAFHVRHQGKEVIIMVRS